MQPPDGASASLTSPGGHRDRKAASQAKAPFIKFFLNHNKIQNFRQRRQLELRSDRDFVKVNDHHAYIVNML